MGYPRRILPIVAIVLTSAFVLEAMQLLDAGPPWPRVRCAGEAVGGLCSIGAGRPAMMILQDQICRFKKLLRTIGKLTTRLRAAIEPPEDSGA